MMHGRRVLLMVNSCPTHPRNIELFLPPKMTSKIQPCDVGIIKPFKIHYRRRVHYKILKGCEVAQSYPKKDKCAWCSINLTILVWMINVQKETIANCFKNYKVRSRNGVARHLI